MDTQASDLFEDFAERLAKREAAGGDLAIPNLRAWAHKAHGQVARIAATIAGARIAEENTTWIDTPGGLMPEWTPVVRPVINAAEMAWAIAAMETYFIEQARALLVYGTIPGRTRDIQNLAVDIIHFLQTRRAKHINPTDVEDDPSQTLHAAGQPFTERVLKGVARKYRLADVPTVLDMLHAHGVLEYLRDTNAGLTMYRLVHVPENLHAFVTQCLLTRPCRKKKT
jgi:hypothetical protein